MRFIWTLWLLLCLDIFADGRSLMENDGKQPFNLNISQKPCNVGGRSGICMFNQECSRKRGEVLGTCLDGFIFGACCSVKESEDGQDEEDHTEANTDPLGILQKIDKLLGSLNKSALILANGTIKELENGTAIVPISTKVEVDHDNIENMMNSIFDNVIQQFDNKLPNILNELTEPDEEDDDETTTIIATKSSAEANISEASDIDTVSEISEITENSIDGSATDRTTDSVASNTEQTTQDSKEIPATTSESATATTEIVTTTTEPSATPLVDNRDAATTESTTTTTTTTTTLSTTLETTTTTTTSTTPTSTVSWDYRTDCGVRPIRGEGRIVGGTKSQFGDWPWHVLVKESTLLGLFTKNKCGGVLISNKHVLTAAHCQPGFLASLIVELGEYDVSGATEFMPTRQAKVKRFVVHKDYQAPTFENDIAIMELESEVSREPHIVPICMPMASDLPFEGKTAIVTGWGRLEYGGAVPNILHQVSVPILENSKCQNMFITSGHKKNVRESFLCAGYEEGKKDSCEGDSGGPLMMQREDRRWVLAGTVSHGIKCAYPNLPGIYMRMSFYKPWIESVTGISFET